MSSDTTPRSRVVVRRMWHSPEIHAFVTHEHVGASMDLNDFVRCLVSETYGSKNRLLALSRADAVSKLLDATDVVLAEMKKTTTSVA